jgi:pyruvate/2-oxoglutarate dehydrogenase complex dihydrolipoamide acyltransferase (E2) component
MEYITEKRRVSDAAAFLAKLHGIDLRTVKGTGAGGRIVREDIDAAIAAKGKAKSDKGDK